MSWVFANTIFLPLHILPTCRKWYGDKWDESEGLLPSWTPFSLSIFLRDKRFWNIWAPTKTVSVLAQSKKIRKEKISELFGPISHFTNKDPEIRERRTFVHDPSASWGSIWEWLPSLLSVQHSPPPHCTLLLPVQYIHSVTNQGGGELRQAPTEIGCCLCVIMLLWEPQWVCFLRSLLKSFAWLGFSPSTDTDPLGMGSREAEMESCILMARVFYSGPSKLEPSWGCEELKPPAWFHKGWRTWMSCFKSPLLSYVGAERSCPCHAPTLLQIHKQNNCYFKRLSFGVICYTVSPYLNTHLLGCENLRYMKSA